MSVHFSNTNPPATGGDSLVTFQIDPSTGEISAAYTPGGGGGGSIGGVNSQTVNYTADTTDNGKIISMNGTSLTLLLPAAPPSSTWKIFIANLNATDLTVDPNGLTIDGSASTVAIPQNKGIYLSTDGTNYFTERGMGSSGTVTHTGALTADQVVVGNGSADIKVLASPSDATKFLNGAATPAFAQVKDSDLSLSNITTNDVSVSKHGFAPVLPNNAAVYLDGTGNYTTPPGTGGGSASSVTTSSLSYTAGETKNFTLAMAKMFGAFNVSEASNKKFRLRLYSTSAARTADASRPFTVPLALGTQHGCILDLYINQVGAVTPWTMTPNVFGSNGDAVPPSTTNIYAAVTNIDTSTQTIAVTINFVIMET